MRILLKIIILALIACATYFFRPTSLPSATVSSLFSLLSIPIIYWLVYCTAVSFLFYLLLSIILNIYKWNWLIKFGTAEAKERVEEGFSQLKEQIEKLENSNEALTEDKHNLEGTIEVLFEKYKNAVKELKK